jgi:von Willebrand factor type A domain
LGAGTTGNSRSRACPPFERLRASLVSPVNFLLAVLSPWQRSLLDWLGHDFSQSSANAEAELLWTNLPESWGVFVLLAVVAGALYGVIWLYRRELATCPPWGQLLLASLRGGAVLLLVLIFLGPALVDLERRTSRPTIVLARDASQSMNTPDRYADEAAASQLAAALGQAAHDVQAARPTRTRIVNELLRARAGQLLAALAERGELAIIDFAERATPVAIPPPTSPARLSLPDLVAEGRGTDLAGAIRQALATDNPAAIILFSDGQHTGRDDPREAAREAQTRGVPLLVVGIGDPSQPRNLKVASVYVRPQAWQAEPFEIEAVIAAEGSAVGSALRVELIEQRIGENQAAVGSGSVVQSLQLPAPDAPGRWRAQFTHTAPEAGRFLYSVRVESIANELDDSDNQLSSGVVTVLNRERVRVLLVSGGPTWEYRLVQKLLARDKTITLSCWLQTLDVERPQEGTRPISRLPATREELFFYDVILLFDPNPQEFDPAWITLLRQFVGEHAGGLLFLAGPQHTGSLLMDPRTASIAQLLPVSFGDLGALEVAALLATTQQPWPLHVAAASADHPVLRFFPDRDESLRRWESLPGVLWSFPAVAAQPTAQVLLEHGDPALRGVHGARPLLVAGRYGSGHTLYLGCNGIWRWRKAGRQAEFFDKFWIQAIRHLVAGRALEGSRRGYLQTDRERYELGDRIAVTARLYDAAFQPLVLPRIDAVHLAAGEEVERTTLLPAANPPGAYEATLVARQVGVHTLRVVLPGDNGEPESIETPFAVELPGAETQQSWLNAPLLADLANLSGGRYLGVHQLDQLATEIPDRTETVEFRGPPRPLWDVSGMFVALIGLLATEWFLRKRFQLL